MHRPMTWRQWGTTVAASAAAATLVTVPAAGATPVATKPTAAAASPAITADTTRGDHLLQWWCTWQLRQAARIYIDTTVRRDARRFKALLADDYTAVLPDGSVLAGKPAGSAFIDRFFARTDWTQTFTTTREVVEGCRSAVVLFDSTYRDAEGAVRLVIGLSWTYRHGRWLVLLDQNTPTAA